jgi:protein ImuB
MNATLPLDLFSAEGLRSPGHGGRREPRLQPVTPPGLRWLVVHLPAFRLERCGWGADDLVVVGATRRSALRVVALTPAARAEGLALGTTIAEARALVPGLHVEALDEAGEQADRRELARAFERFGDRVELDGDDGLVLEIGGTSPLFGGEAAMLAQVRARCEELGHRCRLAVADHPRAARALARHAEADVVAPPGGAAAVLAALPVEALEPSEGLAEALVALGVRTVGAWARLEAASVAGRFGAEGVELHRVARGRPAVAWVDRPTPAPLEPLRVTLDEEAASVDALLGPLAEGLRRLRDRLAARDLVVARLDVRLELAWGSRDDLGERLSVRVARPTRDPELLLRLVRHLLGQRLGRPTGGLPAPVVAVELHAVEVAPDGDGQQDLLARREGQGTWSELLARLVDVLGEQAVVEAVSVDAWRPEEAWGARPVLGDVAAVPVAAADDDPVERLERARWYARRPRPTLLRHPPLPLRVREEGGRPVAVHARQGWRAVRRAKGPERLAGAWWRPDGGFDRAYWAVALPEGTAWLFHERGQWFLHGWWD